MSQPPPFANLHTGAYATEPADLPPAADLVDMLEDGWTRDEIADHFDCSTSTVARRLSNSGLLEQSAEPYRRNKLTIEQRGEIRARVRRGDAHKDIAAEYGVSRSNVTYIATHDEDSPRLALDDQPWAAAAVCAQTDPESFFPEKGGSTREAKAICATCTVAAECLDYAIDNDERFGIWGGLSERERRKVKRALQARPAQHHEQEPA